MKSLKKLFVLILSACLLLSAFAVPTHAEYDQTDFLACLENLDLIAETVMDKSMTPGVSIAVINKSGVWLKSYGYMDQDQKTPVDADTLFELGSMSKAFTALGILYLEQEGSLQLSDPIQKYIPWLSLEYHGKYKGQKIDGEVDVTIENVLHQTTGLPFKTIGSIPEGNSDDALEQTVRTLIGTHLDFYPGTRYSYATINYDILGLIIQNISGQSYESFIKDKILIPLGLTETYTLRNEAAETNRMSAGFKTELFRPHAYDAPQYRGNTPAGYIISSAKDMARWMQIQLGWIDLPEPYEQLIEKSHMGDSTVASHGDYYYAAGWTVHIRGEYVTHGGSNPNFSSDLVIDMEEGIGICVLTNQNSSAPSYITGNFLNALQGTSAVKYKADTYQTMDSIFSLIFIGSVILGVLFFVLLVKSAVEMGLKKRQYEKLKSAKVAGMFVAIPIMLFFGFCVYYLPNILFERLPWEAVSVWGSRTIVYGSIAGFFAGIIFFIYVIFTFNFPKPKEKNYVALVPLSLINGLTSALIIFTINETFNRNLEYSKELLIYFIFSLSFFCYSNRLFQSKMIVMTNEIAYEKRIAMIDRIVASSYQAIEKIGGPRLYSGLHNDTGVYASLPGMIINFASNAMTLIFCLYYLFSISVPAFIASVSILILNAFVGYLTSRVGKKYWEKNRDIQDIYFGQMNDLVYGFKELVLSRLRKSAFLQEMKKYSRLSMELSKTVAVKFLNYGLYGQIMYNAIFGVVVFIFPLFVVGINANDLRQTLFMVFYLLGPVGAVVGIIPSITNVRVNLNRIKKLLRDLDEISTGYSEMQSALPPLPKDISIRFESAAYSYITKDPETEEDSVEFTLGPINTEIRSGEITFITGGNGSGKSTLGKLVTGLYAVQEGKILVNGHTCNMVELNQCFSAVYSDFYLFNKLYGVDLETKKEEVEHLLKVMRIDNKVTLNDDGSLNSMNLSTGQRKRLAYIICCLDEKPFLLFDEWAAEQDPEFRKYFYTELLPALKKKGKGVVVITHDDRFFHLADNMIKLERGVIV